MPKLRMEQLQRLTLTNESISDGRLYDATGAVKSEFDSSRLIDQNKVKDLNYQPNGWISRGIINNVEVLPEWTAENEGRLFYVNNSDQLYLGVGTEPWYILISGDTASGWDAELTVRTGMDGIDWNGTMATQFRTTSYTFAPDGSDLFVYMNGNLQRLDHDYELVDQMTIRMTRNLLENDTVTMLVHLSSSLLNYATKSWVFDQIQSGGIQHSLDSAYDDGSIVSVDNRDVDFRLRTDNKFIISEAAGSISLPATHSGTNDLRFGHDWQTRWQSFDVVSHDGGNVNGPHRVFLNSPAVNAMEIATEISEGLVNAGINDLFGFIDDNNIGIQSTAIGSDISFDLYSGTNLLPITGHNVSSTIGDDDYSSYHKFGLNVTPSLDSGLENNERFWFNVNGNDYSISTGIDTTYDQLRSLVGVEIAADGFTATTDANDIVVTRDQPGLPYPTLITPVTYNGQIEITQVTTIADNDRSLSEKSFNLTSIDKALFGHEKEYTAWFHLDAESEVSTITTTSETSNVTLADKSFQLQTPSNDYFVWYEVETPQTSGYQGLGLTSINAGTSTGLIQDETYDFKLSVDDSVVQDLSITTPPDIQPVNEITDITVLEDVSQSLSGKYVTLNSQTGTGYYVWYNIDTVAGSETMDITAIADVSQSLSGKSFSIFAPGNQYYAWLSMMTDAGLPALVDTNDVTITADVSQSLSGKYFNLDSADGSQFYVWYNMMTDAGITATPETSTITTTADFGQSLSSKYFEFSSTTTNYYAWYRMQTAEPISAEVEITDVILPANVNKSLSGKHWTFNTPYNEYYTWYRTEENAMIPAAAERTAFSFDSATVADYIGESVKVYNFNDPYDIVFDAGGFKEDFESGINGWDSSSTSTLTAGAGIATLTSTGTDPWIFKSDFSFDGLTNRYIRAKIKRIAGTGWDGHLLYSTSSHSWDGTKIKTITEPIYDGDGWAVIELDMHNLTSGADDWKDNIITGLRLDLGNTVDDVFQIEYIETGLNLDGYTNPIVVNISEETTANDVTVKTILTINDDVSLPFIANGLTTTSMLVTNNNNGAQLFAPIGSTNVTVSVYTIGTDMTPATFSTNPSPAGKTGVQINVFEGDTNTEVATKTNAQLALLGDITTEINGSTITITNVDNGTVENALDVDSSTAISIINEGVTAVPAQYSANPMVVGSTGVVVDIFMNDDADTVAAKTAAQIDAIVHFTSTATDNDVEINVVSPGENKDVEAGDSGFGVVVTIPGVNYVAPTFSTDPIPNGRSAIQIDIVEDDTALVIAEATKIAIDSLGSFSSTRANAVVTITDQTTGPVEGTLDVDSGFGFNTTQEGQDYVAPIYTTDPTGTGTGIQIDINENDTATAVAQAIEARLNNFKGLGLTINRTLEILSVTVDDGGIINDAVDIDSGFTIDITSQGYEAYSSNDPSPVGRTGMKVTIAENETANIVAAKTQIVINNSLDFTASNSLNKITITDNNGGDVFDATPGDSGFSIDVSVPGVDLIPADVSWGNILGILNTATSSPATWAIDNGDIKIISNQIGSWTKAELFSGDGQDLLIDISGFTALNSFTNGTSSYSAQPVGTGTGIKTPILVGADAATVAFSTVNSIDTVDGLTAVLNAGVDDNKLTVTNDTTGIVSDISDSGTQFVLEVLNQGANESVDPTEAGRNGIQINVNKHDDANAIAIAAQSAIDIGGEFYVTRLNNILSVQNDFPGLVSETVDVDSTFGFTKTGTGEDVKYSLFGTNGLNQLLPSPIDGIDALPADTGVGTESLTNGYNFYAFNRDFSVIINSEPIAEVFLDQACYNSSEIVSHANTKILEAGLINLEAYQIAGQIGFRTVQTGRSQTLEMKNSLSDALETLGWTAGTYAGDFGAAEAILEVTALSGQNLITVDADIIPSDYGTHNIGSETEKFKEIWAQEAHFDEGTIYIGDNTISVEADEFAFIVDDGENTYDFFGNADPAIAPVGASRLGVDGIVGIIPEKAGAAPGDTGTLQEMLTGIGKSAGGGKLFPDMSSTGANYKDPTNLKGFLSEKAAGLYLKLNEVIMIESINREIRVLTQDDNIVEGTGWIFRNDDTDPIGGRSVKYDLTPLDVNKEPTTGELLDDSFHVKTTGGIKLETGSAMEVGITNDLSVAGNVTIEGDLVVEGDTVTLNVATLAVEDNIITLNKNVAGAPSLDAGIEIERGTSTNAKVVWDESDDLFRAGITGNEKAIATRADTQTNNGVATWDTTTANYVTNTKITYDESKLYVSGDIDVSDDVYANQFRSSIVTGTAPIIVASTTKVTNLNADLLDGITATPTATRNNVANQVVTTQASGYIEAGWINTTSGDTTNTLSDIYVNTNDGYIRKCTPAHFRSQITDATYVNATGDTMTGNLEFGDYGEGIVGKYSATKYQGVFAMGSAYTLDSNGTLPSGLYGIAWSHANNTDVQANNLTGHGMLVMQAGVTYAAIGTDAWFKGNVTGAKVYNAVWNDIADFIEVEDDCVVVPGKCYFIGKDFKHSTTTEVSQKGVLGIASDTYGYGLGKDDDKHQLPLAVGGFVLAYIEGEVEPGDVLTSSTDGNLVVMSLEDKRNYPERIVATYYKPQLENEYHGLIVNGRHWVKVS